MVLTNLRKHEVRGVDFYNSLKNFKMSAFDQYNVFNEL